VNDAFEYNHFLSCIQYPISITPLKNIELFGIIFIKKRNRNTHYFVIINRNILCLIDIDNIIIIIFRIFFRIIFFPKNQFFITNIIIKICVPTNPFYLNILILMISNICIITFSVSLRLSANLMELQT
jgi:hypothetical protein